MTNIIRYLNSILKTEHNELFSDLVTIMSSK